MSIKNKIVFITGASSGIGEACAHLFASQGARLILCARNQDKLTILKTNLTKNYRADVYVLPLDVANHDTVKTGITSLPADWQAVDILINSAGLALGLETIQRGNPTDWDRMIDTNVKGLLYVTHYVLKGMITRNKGHIITLGSISSHAVYPTGVVYCATKYAVKAISEGLKMDVHGTPIRITEIDPGSVETEFSNTRFKGNKTLAAMVYEGYTPLSAGDVADAILYAVLCPAHVNIRQILLTPTDQTNIHMINRKNTDSSSQ